MNSPYRPKFQEAEKFEEDFMKKLKSKILEQLKIYETEGEVPEKVLKNKESFFHKVLNEFWNDRDLDRLIEKNIERLL
jgi:hypothetical protein